MSLKIESFDNPAIFETLHDEWHDLHAHAVRCPIFTTWEWQVNWWAAYHPGELWVITLRDDSGLLVGIAPWFIQEFRGERWVRSIGCVDVTDFLELPLRQGYEGPALQALTDYVLSQSERYDRLDFCNIPESSPVLEVWPPLLEKAGYTVSISQQEVCPIITLPETFDVYISSLDKKNRHELRRKLRHARAQEDKITWGYAAADDTLNDSLERFLGLMRASNPQKAEFLDDSQHVDFFRRVMPAIAARGWLKLSLMQVNGKDVAGYLSFDYNNQILLYNSGYDPVARPDLGLGIVLLAYIIEDAILQGREVFDFLRGNEEYKYRMGGVDSPVMILTATL